MKNHFADLAARKHTEKLKGHGRVKEITCYQMPVPPELVSKAKWAGPKTIGVAFRQSKSGSKSSVEVRYYVASIPMGG